MSTAREHHAELVERIRKDAHANAVRLEDGNHVYHVPERGGFSPWHLRVIADVLEELDAEQPKGGVK